MTLELGTIIADFTTSLATALAIGGESATLSSATDDDSVALPSGRYFFTIDASNSDKEHISCDLSGTSLTNIKSVSRQGVESTGVVRAHRIGASVMITDHAAIISIQDVLESGYATATTPVSDYELATKKYVDDIAMGGSTTVDRLTVAGTAGETIAAGNLIYLKSSDGRWWLADADTASSSENVTIAVAQGSVSGGGVIPGGVLLRGTDTNQTGLSANTIYYASDTAGAISSSAGTKEVTVGIALDSTTLQFEPRYNQQLTEDQQDALAGSSGTPSASNKYETQYNTSAAEANQSQTTQNATTAIGEADATTKRNKIAQSFMPTVPSISGVKLYKSAGTGSFTGTVTVTLEADSSGSPSGSALATVTITNAQYLALATGEFTAIFGTEYTSMVVGDLYWIVISTSTADTSNCPNLGTNSAGGYASGSTKYNNTTDGWVAISTVDLYFKTIEGVVSKVVKTGTDGKIPALMENTDYLGTSYAVGVLSSAFKKTYFNMKIPFLLYTSITSAYNGFENWTRSSTTLVSFNPLGLYSSFSGAGSAFTQNDIFYDQTSRLYGFNSSSGSIVLDFMATLSNSPSGSINMGFFSSSAGITSVYNDTNYDKVAFTQDSSGNLYATISKASVGNTSTRIYGIDVTKMNNYRIELNLANNALFYVNGTLVATLSGANFPTASGVLLLGFGRSATASFRIFAPDLAIKMNP